MSTIRKILVLDGISGVPLGRELVEAFTDLGCASVHFDCLQQSVRPFYGLHSAYAKLRNRGYSRDEFYFLPKLQEKNLQQVIEKEQPSHILVIGFSYKFFDPARLRQLADAAGAALFLYDTDTCNLYGRRREFIFFVEQELPVYEHIFSCSQVTTRFFQATRGLDASFVPFGAKSIITGQTTKNTDVLFVGSCDLRRILLLEGIREHVSIRGNRWKRNLPLISSSLRERIDDSPIWGEALHHLLGQAKIVLNITRSDFYGAETGINLRIFEALAAGCFLLTDHCDEISQLFTPGVELETYHSANELADKVAYYLSHDNERIAVAHRGHEAFLANHTWHTRLKKQILPRLSLCGTAPKAAITKNS